MAGEAGKVVGRISVKVMPDTSEFREKLRDELKRIQAATQVNLNVVLDARSMRDAKRDLDNWADRAEQKVDVSVDMNKTGLKLAQARMASLARTRIARIVPVVDQAAATKAAGALGTLVAAASGGRVVTKLMKNVIDTFKELDTLAPMIGAIGIGILNLAAGGLALSSNLFALSSALASIGALTLTFPASMAAAAIGIGVLFAAFKDFNSVMPEVKSKLSELQNLISSNFWSKAEAPMRRMIDELLPQFSTGLGTVATKFGEFFGSLSTALTGALDGSITGMFDQLSSSIEIAKGAAEPLAGAITTLGKAGADYLPRMSQWVVDITTKFDEWLTKVTGNGDFDRWIQNGLTALSDLGRVAKATGGILSGIADAAQAAGGSSLDILADSLEKIRAVVETPAFQTGLTAAFTGAHKAMEALSNTAGPALTTFFVTLGTSLEKLLPIAGEALGVALGGIATALTSLLQSGGVEVFLQGITNALVAIAPVMPTVGTAFGQLAIAMGTFFTALGPNLGVLIQTLATALIQLMPVLTPLIVSLGTTLSGALTTLAPIITQIVSALAGMLTPLASNQGLVTGLVTAFLGMKGAGAAVSGVTKGISAISAVKDGVVGTAQTLGRVRDGFNNAAAASSAFSGTAGTVGGVLRKAADGAKFLATQLTLANAKQVVMTAATKVAAAVQWALNAAMTANPIGLIIAAIVALIAGLVLLFKKNETFRNAVMAAWNGIKAAVSAVADWFTGTLLPILQAVWQSIVTGVQTAINFVSSIIQSVLAFIGAVWEGFWGTFGGLITAVWGAIVAAVELYITIIWTVIQVVAMAIMAVWNFLWNGIKAVVMFVWNGIVAAITFYVNLILTVITTVWNAIKAATSAVWNGIKAVFSAVWGFIGPYVMGVVNGIRNTITSVWTTIKTATSAAWDTVKSKTSEVWDSLKGIVSGAVTKLMTVVDGIKGKVTGAFDKAKDWLLDAGEKVIQGFIDGLTKMFDSVKTTLQGLTEKLKDWKGPAPVDRKLLTPAGVLVMQSFLTGLESQYDTIRRSLRGFTSEIGGMEVAAPRVTGAAVSAAAAVNGSISAEPSSALAGADIDINLHGSDVSAEDVAGEFVFAARRMELGGLYAGRTNP